MDTTIVVAIIAAIATLLVAIITLLGVCLTACLGFLTWSRNIKYQILKDERDRLEQKFESALECFHGCLHLGEVDTKMAALFNYEFPKNVRDEFNKAVSSGDFNDDHDDYGKQDAYFRMAMEMSIAVKEYNNKIFETSEVIDKKFAAKLAFDIIKSGVLRF